MKKIIHLLTLLLLISLSGCAIANRSKGVSSTFLGDVDVSKKLDGMPFIHSWIWTEIPPGQYHSVVVKPVRVDLLEPEAWKASLSLLLTTKESYDKKAAALAIYFQEQLIDQIHSYPNTRITVTEQPGAGTAVIEIALTEIEFSHPGIHGAAIAVPVPGASQALATVSDPHAAFALRISDSVSGKLLASIADRKFPPLRIVDINKATISSSVREICSNWSKEIASTLNEWRVGKVESYGKIKLLPW